MKLEAKAMSTLPQFGHLFSALTGEDKMTTTTSNLHAVSSPAHFQELLNADLERVAVLYFYADWAEPCAAMTQAIAAMAEAYPAVLFLQIEAEALPEISESFEVDEVPYTILLRVGSFDLPLSSYED